MTNILYLHGLEGNLSDEKRAVLEQYGVCIAPEIDYRQPQILQTLLHIAQQNNATQIIGSSMGGYVGFAVARILNLECLLFNPAFPYRSVEPDMSGIEIPETKTTKTTIVLGKKDMVIKHADNLLFIQQNLKNQNITIREIETLEHHIPIEIFEMVMNDYF